MPGERRPPLSSARDRYICSVGRSLTSFSSFVLVCPSFSLRTCLQRRKNTGDGTHLDGPDSGQEATAGDKLARELEGRHVHCQTRVVASANGDRLFGVPVDLLAARFPMARAGHHASSNAA